MIVVYVNDKERHAYEADRWKLVEGALVLLNLVPRGSSRGLYDEVMVAIYAPGSWSFVERKSE